MANSLMDFQNKANQNRLFQSKFMANQALGEIMGHANSTEEGLNEAMKNPLIMGFGGEALQNLRASQLLNLQGSEITQNMTKSGYLNTLNAGALAIQDPLNYKKYFESALNSVPENVRGQVRSQIQAFEDSVGQKLSKYDLSKPGQLDMAKKDLSALLGGAFMMAGGDPSHVAPFLSTTKLDESGIPMYVPSPMEAATTGAVPHPIQQGAPPRGAAPTIDNPSGGKPIAVDTSSAASYMKGRSVYGLPILSDEAKAEDADLQKKHADQIEQYQGANNAIANLSQMDADISELAQHGGLTTPGFLGVARGELAKAIQTFTMATGMELPESMKNLPTDVADVETINKYQHVLTFMAKKAFEGTGARGLGVLMEASSAVPGMENTPLGFMVISAGLKAAAKWQAGNYEFKEKWKQDRTNTGGSLVGSEMAYNKAFSPLEATQDELKKVGMEIDPTRNKMVFRSDDDLLKAYDNGLLGKPGSNTALSAYNSMYADRHPEEKK